KVLVSQQCLNCEGWSKPTDHHPASVPRHRPQSRGIFLVPRTVRAPLASRNAHAGGARDVKNSEGTDLLSKNCSLNRDVECPSVGTIFAHSFSEPVSHGAPLYHWQEGGPEPYRPARRQPRAHAPPNACNEPGEARCRTRPQLPAGTEIREGRQPHRGRPIAATLPYPAGATRVLL